MSSYALSMYLSEINKIPMLGREEEKRLAAAAANGSKAARDRLVSANLRFVVSVAKKYQNQGLELDDLVNEGNIGLMTAVDRFDASRGFHFISYAVWWIRQSILKAIAEKSRAIRLPMNRAADIVRIERARGYVSQGDCEAQEIRAIAKLLGLEEKYVRELTAISQGMASLDEGAEGKDSNPLGTIISAPQAQNPDELLINDSMRNDVREVLGTLRPNEQKVMRMRYGLDGSRPMSLKEVGSAVNLTKERVRQIEKSAEARLKLPSRRRVLESYVA